MRIYIALYVINNNVLYILRHITITNVQSDVSIDDTHLEMEH